ncbi:MAG: FAD-dependent monooxygenase [Ferruginibacter sp.]
MTAYSNSKTQVVIVGAGPTGLSLAIQLLRYNISFVILEKNEGPTPLSKAVVIQARTLEIFMETELASKAIERGRLTTGANIFYNGRKRANLNLAGMGEGLSPFPFALSLEQSKTEELLVEYLVEHGKNIQWETEFTHYDDTAGLKVHYKDVNGAGHVIEAAYLVGCDGAGSLVRHQMGAHFEGDTIPKIFYVADVELESSVINRDELFMFLIKKGFVLYFPMEGEGHYRMIGILPDKTADDIFHFEDIEAGIREQMMIPVSFKKLRWFSSYKVHSRKADFFRKGNCLIAGDAGHIHTPAGGQGMNTGIQDAYNLGWKLAYTLQYNANNSLLDSYNTERTENAAHLLETTDRMFDFMTGSGRWQNFARLNILPILAGIMSRFPVINKRVFPLISQTGIAYSKSVLTVKSSIGKVAAGDRMPYILFKSGQNIFDHVKIPGFKLLYFGKGEAYIPSALQNLPFKITWMTFTEIPEPLFGKADGFYIFLRPDNHISYIGKDINLSISLLKKMELNNS